nr:DNA/RNA helicase domain-containing protein [Sporosarcina sp. ZBG7A]
MEREDPEKAQALADPIIRNMYRTLMTRGRRDALCIARILSCKGI